MFVESIGERGGKLPWCTHRDVLKLSTPLKGVLNLSLHHY